MQKIIANLKMALNFVAIKLGLISFAKHAFETVSNYNSYNPKNLGLASFFLLAMIVSFVLGGFSVFDQINLLADADAIVETTDFSSSTTDLCPMESLNNACVNSFDYYQNISLEAKPENFLNLYLVEDKAFLLRTLSLEEESYLSEPLKKNQIITYTVKAGDSLGKIANSFGINVDTIKVANNLKKTTLTPGQELTILPISGIFYSVKKGDTLGGIALKYKISSSLISEYNDLANDTLKVGQKIILPGAKETIVTPTKIANNTTSTGFKVDTSSSASSSFFIYPTTGWNWGEAHGIDGRAVDIANACGTPIYASASGIVIEVKTSGYNGGYGLYLKIQHDNGTSTLYSHLSLISVTNGQYVNQGQIIGKMGSTGRSTGCHLHFEVIGAKNPFIKK